MSDARHERQLRDEQAYVATLYARLDAERTAASRALDAAMADSAATSPQARWQRDAAVATWSDRRRRLRIADNGLCFGRIDTESDGPVYVGRIGLLDAEDDHRSLLTDWRAPIARPFYCATGANPEGISLRRHFRTARRGVVDFHDERFGVGAGDGQAAGSDAALLAAVNAPRTEVMGDIVATIQAAQDEIIRLGRTGVVVIEGGPGTGKTAVALHRVAYLLYEHRERMARRGVLLLGPHPGFLDYVGGVLPALGETDIVFSTPGELLPGVRTTAVDRADAARVKGSARMVDLLDAAVIDRQRVPADDDPIDIPLDDVTVRLDAGVARAARDRAWASRLVHNQARAVFDAAVIDALTERAVQRIGAGWLEPELPDRIAEEVAAELGAADEPDGLAERLADNVRSEVAGSEALAEALDGLWPMLTPQRLLADLLSTPRLLRRAAAVAGLSDADRDALYRPEGDAWTVSDVPLLDEAVDMLGSDGSEERAAEAETRDELDYAEGVLEILDTEEDPDDEVLRAVDILEADRLAERQVEQDLRSLAERAAADRNWTYGHVVVDEAQELSEMDWRAVMRRCPSRSFTVVGDLAQRGSPAGARSWSDVLTPHVGDRWAYRRLTVNYRTPAEIMDVAAGVLASVDDDTRPPESVRSTGVRPWAREVTAAALPGPVADAAAELAAEVPDGSVAVIAQAELGLPAAMTVGDGDGRRVRVLTPRLAKGLEFDAVLLCEPGRMLADGGASELYVALTRATQRLGVLHSGDLPAALAGLRQVTPAG